MLIKFDDRQSETAVSRFERRLQQLPILFPKTEEPHIQCLYLNSKGVLQIIHNGRSSSEFLIFDLIEYLEAIASPIEGINEIQILDCLVGVSDIS